LGAADALAAVVVLATVLAVGDSAGTGLGGLARIIHERSVAVAC
jgi:hypothetical protein